MACLIFASIGLQEQLSTKAAEQQARVQVTSRRRIPPCITHSLQRDAPFPRMTQVPGAVLPWPLPTLWLVGTHGHWPTWGCLSRSTGG